MQEGKQRIVQGRMMVDPKQDYLLTQGSIFNCAYNEDYKGNEILGLVISARCDIANNKGKKFCYLPVVPFSLWKDKEFLVLIKSKYSKDLEMKAKANLSNIGLSINSLKMYGYEKLVDVVLKKAKKKKQQESIVESIDNYVKVVESKSLSDIVSILSKQIKVELKDIIKNENMNYFFIDDIQGYGACIALLREVGYIDKAVCDAIKGGIDISENSPNKDIYRSLDFSNKDAIASLIGSMSSPYIELVMQRFAHNFVRVGVDDHDENYLDYILDVEI